MRTDQRQWDIVSGVGMTALAVAAGRAIETGRADALVSDPYAAWFVAEAQPPVPMPTSLDEVTPDLAAEDLWSMATEYLGVRSRVFDDCLLAAAEDGATQVVLLASGLDTRAFRLPWPDGTVVYELDQPAVLDFKLRTLDKHGAGPGCTHRPVRADLRDDWAGALEAAGFDRTRPTAWLAEGLLPYLPAAAEERLFTDIDRLSSAGSSLAVEQITDIGELAGSGVLEGSAAAIGADLGTLVHSDARSPVEVRLRALGWATRNVTAEDSAASYGRLLTASADLTRHIVHTFARRS